MRAVFKLLAIFIMSWFIWLIFFKKPGEGQLALGNLVIGTNAEFAPFSFIKDNQITGFDIELALEITKRLGKKPIIKNMDFDMLIPEIQIGGVHLIAAGMTADESRKKSVLFTEPYIQGVPLVIVSLKSNPLDKPDLEGLRGKKVVVNDGFTADLYLSKIADQENIMLIKLPTVADAFLALNNGIAEAYVSAENSLKHFFEQQGKDKYDISKITGTDENCALAVSKKHPELLNDIQKVLNQMEADGSLEALKKKWKL